MIDLHNTDDGEQISEFPIFIGEEDRCPSCDSPNLEVYIKNELIFIECDDCGGKQLLD